MTKEGSKKFESIKLRFGVVDIILNPVYLKLTQTAFTGLIEINHLVAKRKMKVKAYSALIDLSWKVKIVSAYLHVTSCEATHISQMSIHLHSNFDIPSHCLLTRNLSHIVPVKKNSCSFKIRACSAYPGEALLHVRFNYKFLRGGPGWWDGFKKCGFL